MSRLVKALRNKKTDTPNIPVPSKKRKITSKRSKENRVKTITEETFSKIIETFVSNKEAIKRLEEANKNYYPDLVEYTKQHGAKDDKGNKTMRIGNIVSHVLVIKPRELNIDRVQRYIQKLVKRSHLTKKEAKNVVYAEYTLKLREDEYKRLEKHLEDMAILADREVKVDEEQLQLLIHKGVASIDEITNLYDELPEKIQFRPSRLKE
jgi:hypothetical protein